MLKASAHGLGPAGQLLLLPFLGQVVHVTPKPPDYPQNGGSIGQFWEPAKGAVSSPYVLKVSLHGMGAAGPLLRLPILGVFFCLK